MLVIDPSNNPAEAYNQFNESEGMFGQNMNAPYHAHNDDNLIPRDVIPEDENERTQDSALIRITEERDDTRNSNQDNQSQSLIIPKTEDKDDNYEDDYEDEDPVPTKPFDDHQNEAAPVDQQEYLRLLQTPSDRPHTRNPRMQRDGSKTNESKSKPVENLGSFEEKQNNKESNKIEKEIKGGFELPDDSDQ